MNIFTKIFSKSLAFQPVDPLADGLGDQIAAEQQEKQAIDFDYAESIDNLQRFWSEVEADIHSGGGLDFSK